MHTYIYLIFHTTFRIDLNFSFRFLLLEFTMHSFMCGLRYGLVLIIYSTIVSNSAGSKIAASEDPFRFLVHVRSYTESDIQTTAVQDLVKRVLGDRSNDFEVEVNVPLPSATGLDVVEV